MVNLHCGKRINFNSTLVREAKWFVKVKYKIRAVVILFISICVFSNSSILSANSQVKDSQRYLIACGVPIGIKMKSFGVIITGFIGYMDENDEYSSPAKEAGIKEGDRILAINDISVNSIEDMHKAMAMCEENIIVTIEGQNGKMKYNLSLCKDKESGEYKLGIWAKDTIAGIGTLTFYDENNKNFAALGHAISDGNNIYKISGGTLYEAVITDIKKGQIGCPGELHGYFKENKAPLGTIKSNTVRGVYGQINGAFSDSSKLCRFPVGKSEQLKKADAYIMSSAITGKMEKYSIEITQINEKNEEGTKCFNIKIVDKRLLEATGGIVQGMSGSPIVQNGKLVGAVTHVLVNDPTRGYGIFIENMLDAAG